MSFFDKIAGLFGQKPARRTEPSPDALRIRQVRDSGRWRQALIDLDALGQRVFADPDLLVLRIQLKADLAERATLQQDYDRLLSLPDPSDMEAMASAFRCLSAEAKMALAPKMLERIDRFSKNDAEAIRDAIPLPMWPGERVFEILATTTNPLRYDDLLAEATRRDANDPRLARVKARPLDPAEVRRRELEAAKEEQDATLRARKDARDRVLASFRRNLELERAIATDPEDERNYLVYADWLQSKGDPRGELVSVQARLSSASTPELLEEEGRLLAELGPALLNGLGDDTRPEWRLGYLSGVRVAGDDDVTAAERIEMVSELPWAAALRKLTVGVAVVDDENNYEDVIEVLAKQDLLPHLRDLFIGDFDWEEAQISWSNMGPVHRLYGSRARLEALTLRCGDFDLGRIVLPALKRFRIETGGLRRQNLDSILEAEWPDLEALTIWFGDENYGAECGPGDLDPLLAGRIALPRLTTLGLGNAEFTDDLIPLLAASPLLPRLQHLDLTMGTLSDAGAAALVTHKQAFMHLKQLDLRHNCLGERGQALVRALGSFVLVGEQDDYRAGEGARFVAVGE